MSPNNVPLIELYMEQGVCWAAQVEKTMEISRGEQAVPRAAQDRGKKKFTRAEDQ